MSSIFEDSIDQLGMLESDFGEININDPHGYNPRNGLQNLTNALVNIDRRLLIISDIIQNHLKLKKEE